MFCSKCGAKVNDNDEFCNECGATINQAEILSNDTINEGETQRMQQSDYEQVTCDFKGSKNEINGSTKKENLIPLFIILCIVAIASICAIWYMISKADIKPTANYHNIGQTARLEETTKTQEHMKTVNSTQTISFEDSLLN